MTDLPKTGDVYWCENFPGLGANPPKSRYAIVISPPNLLPDKNGLYLVVPTSSSSKSKYNVKLPNRAENPGTTSNLPERCDAVCDEYKLVRAEALTRWIGDVRTPLVSKLQQMVRAVVLDRQRDSGR